MSDSTPKLPFEYFAGDQLPTIGFRYPEALTGFTVTLTLERPGAANNIQRTASITDVTSGTGIVQWQAGDLIAGCDQRAILSFTDSAGRAISYEFLIDVKPSISLAD